MSLKSIFLGPFFDSSIEEGRPSESLVRYAVDLAKSQGAHLSVEVGSLRLSAPSVLLKDVRGLIATVNKERLEHAQAFARNLLNRTRSEGLVADVTTNQEDISSLKARFVKMARLTGVAVFEPSSDTLALQQAIVEDVLFNSGRPIIVVPREWTGSAAPERVIVSWDGSARAARAIGEALPLLEQATEVEIVAVTGDPDVTKTLDGEEIAPHLSRHCRHVTVTQLSSGDGDIAAVLGGHAKAKMANLLVMGAYVHSRFMQMVLGGVTNSMISNPPVPIFMSH